MEKRTILALVLCFFVLFVWSSVFSPKDEQKPESKEQFEKEITQGIPETPGDKTPDYQVSPRINKESSSKAIPEAEETEIEIDTPLYRAVFSNAGPTIKSFRLKKYKQTMDLNSPSIELVELEPGMGDYFLFSFSDSPSSNREKLVYQVNRSSIHLKNDSSPEELLFSSVTSNGLLINQIYRFNPDNYSIDLVIDVVNQSGNQVSGSFIADLNVLPPQEKKSYYSFAGFVLLLNDDLEEVKIKKPSEEKTFRGNIGWVAYEDEYFISSIIQKKESKASFEGRLLHSGILQGTYFTPQISINPSQQVSSEYSMYFGPRDLGTLKEAGNNLAKAIDFGWTDILAKPLLYMLRFFNNYIHN
ncbi:MAG TPA: YidC/Oxa1 family membrane protein insertase, partial [Desulfobacteraceae bacterium]|nr:YidC/Oxa1 family membrane protein insertase [Desulfobacteraceae bacterium]